MGQQSRTSICMLRPTAMLHVESSVPFSVSGHNGVETPNYFDSSHAKEYSQMTVHAPT